MLTSVFFFRPDLAFLTNNEADVFALDLLFIDFVDWALSFDISIVVNKVLPDD